MGSSVRRGERPRHSWRVRGSPPELEHQLDLEALVLRYVDNFNGLTLNVLLLSARNIPQMPVKEGSDNNVKLHLPDGHAFVVIEVAPGLCTKKFEAEEQS